MIVGGYVMAGAIIANNSNVTMADITPLYVVVVAPPTARSALPRIWPPPSAPISAASPGRAVSITLRPGFLAIGGRCPGRDQL